MIKIYARLIYKGIKVIEQIPLKYREAVREAYFEIYGLEI